MTITSRRNHSSDERAVELRQTWSDTTLYTCWLSGGGRGGGGWGGVGALGWGGGAGWCGGGWGEGRGARGEGRGARGEGRGARGEGRGARGEGRGARGEGRGARGEGRGARGEGRRFVNQSIVYLLGFIIGFATNSSQVHILFLYLPGYDNHHYSADS